MVKKFCNGRIHAPYAGTALLEHDGNGRGGGGAKGGGKKGSKGFGGLRHFTKDWRCECVYRPCRHAVRPDRGKVRDAPESEQFVEKAHESVALQSAFA